MKLLNVFTVTAGRLAGSYIVDCEIENDAGAKMRGPFGSVASDESEIGLAVRAWLDENPSILIEPYPGRWPETPN